MFINEGRKVIEMNAKEYDRAMTYGTEEYKALREIRNDYPGFEVTVVSVKKPVKVKDKLNMKTIKAYVKANGTEEQKAHFEEIAFPHFSEEGVYIEACSFFEITKWFYAEFPKYKEARERHLAEVEKIFNEVDEKITKAKKAAEDQKRTKLADDIAKFREAA